MKKYRILSLVLALVMIFSVGCASEVEPAPEKEVIEKTVEEPIVADKGETTAVADAAIAYLVDKPADSYIVKLILKALSMFLGDLILRRALLICQLTRRYIYIAIQDKQQDKLLLY